MPTEQNVPEEIIDQRKEVISDLRNLPVGLDDTLAETVIAGVAFHRTFPVWTQKPLLTPFRRRLDY